MHGTSGQDGSGIDTAEPVIADSGTLPAKPAEPTGLADSELKALSLQARRDGNEPLRRLVASYLLLRRVTAEVITLVSAREGGSSVANTPLLRRARELSDTGGPS